MGSPSPRERKLRPPHPLAAALIERLRSRPHARVLDFGSGSGRNTDALTAAGFSVCAVPDDRMQQFTAGEEFDAAISTHAFLHGTPARIGATLAKVARMLEPDAPLFVTFASKADARYGRGTRIEEDVYAPDSGEERGVPHAYFDEATLRVMLDADFTIEAVEEYNVDEIVGSWAHAQRPKGAVHWLVRVHRTAPA